jgi:hypothetical protein
MRGHPLTHRKVWVAAFCLFSALLITIAAWAGRLMMYPDGVSYMDMADKLAHGDASPLLHPYWSPLYPCILAVALTLFPDPATQFQAAHIANWLIGLGALAAFTFFVNSDSPLESLSSFRCRTALAYALFLWGAVEAVGLVGVSPDLCVMAEVFLAAGLCRRRPSVTAALSLGAVLALACVTKAALVPLSVVLMILLAVPARIPRRMLAMSLLTFSVLLIPYVAGLSLRQHHLTFGESGKLNYAWLVLQEVPQSAGWRDAATPAGTPLHPPRLLSDDPPVIEFAGPVSATNPIWYDPAYFHEGLQVGFDLRKQVATIVRSISAFRSATGTILFPVLAGLVVLGCRVNRLRFIAQLSRSTLLYWSLAAFCLYALVIIEPRYIAAFLVLFWFTLFEALSPAPMRSWSRAAVSVTAICILLFQIQGVFKSAADSAGRAKSAAQFVAAQELERLGLQPGDSIATVGHGFEAYYAKLARLHIVANIGYLGGTEPVMKGFQPLDEIRFIALEDKLRPLHLKAIVSPCGYIIPSARWRALGNSGFCARVPAL